MFLSVVLSVEQLPKCTILPFNLPSNTSAISFSVMYLRERLQTFNEVLFGGTLAVNVFGLGESKQQVQYGFYALAAVRMFVPVAL